MYRVFLFFTLAFFSPLVAHFCAQFSTFNTEDTQFSWWFILSIFSAMIGFLFFFCKIILSIIDPNGGNASTRNFFQSFLGFIGFIPLFFALKYNSFPTAQIFIYLGYWLLYFGVMCLILFVLYIKLVLQENILSFLGFKRN